MSRCRRNSRGGLAAAVILSLCVALPAAASAQEAGIVIVDQERMFQQSLYGQRILDEIDRRSASLASENREIEAELVAEERALTDLRSTLETEEFRLRAAAFDEKVTRIRASQDAKARALSRVQEEARQEFVRLVEPILSQMLDGIGASILLDRRVVLSAGPEADITDRAIARIDTAIGPGEDLPHLDPAPGDGPPEPSAPDLGGASD
ncbi:OmpH family outer membrane protein [Palleronia rufa]|uniref:OmpH family outer membrane protein n=1 Tax=Palleronia rufa TaxID=1530186 RepID=UPI0009DDA186|nr:OmpH family outer membrane protein [Palleronia rufa]